MTCWRTNLPVDLFADSIYRSQFAVAHFGARFTKYLTIILTLSISGSGLQCAQISLRNILRQFTKTSSDDLTRFCNLIVLKKKPCILHKLYCTLDIYRKSIATLALS